MAHENEDMLKEAIFAALQAAEDASEALHGEDGTWMPNGPLRRQIADLDQRLDKRHLFSSLTLDRVDAVSRVLAQASELEWVTELIPDEHCMSGTWEHSFLSKRGKVIARAHLKVNNLAAALRAVRDYLQAEELAATLRL